MAVYINYGEQDQDAVVQGAEWLMSVIQQQQGPEAEERFKTQFQQLHSDESREYNYGAVFDLFIEYSGDLFAAIPEGAAQGRGEDRVKEVESFFALLLSLLLYLEDADHMMKLVDTLCKLFVSSTEQQPELRLRLLMMLYNTFPFVVTPFKFRVFMYIVDYAAKAGLFEQVLPYLEYLDSWMVDWEHSGLEVKDKRELYLNLSEYMRELGQRDLGKRVDAFLYLKKYAQLFQGESDSASDLSEKEVQEATLKLLKDAIQLPSVIQFDDLLHFKTVKALEKGKHQNLVKLCRVFLTGDVNDLSSFQKKNAQMFKEHDLDFEAAMSKIRLLTLATLVQGKSEIALAEVAEALEESEDNVEHWVVKALSEGVIDGRIDQLNHKVLVKSAFQRQFGNEEWGFLDKKLTQWTDNLENVIKFIEDQKLRTSGK